MVHSLRKYGSIFHVCDECGFGYRCRETAERCEKYCKSHGVCSFDITRKAVSMPTYP